MTMSGKSEKELDWLDVGFYIATKPLDILEETAKGLQRFGNELQQGRKAAVTMPFGVALDYTASCYETVASCFNFKNFNDNNSWPLVNCLATLVGAGYLGYLASAAVWGAGFLGAATGIGAFAATAVVAAPFVCAATAVVIAAPIASTIGLAFGIGAGILKIPAGVQRSVKAFAERAAEKKTAALAAAKEALQERLSATAQAQTVEPALSNVHRLSDHFPLAVIPKDETALSIERAAAAKPKEMVL